MRPANTPEPRDDVDHLFARLHSVAPPPDLTARIMGALPGPLPAAPARVAPAAPPAARRPWGWVTAGAGLVLLVMSLRLGTLLDDSGALAVLGQIFADFSDFLGDPGDYLAPLASELPWLDLSVAVAALALFWFSSSAIIDGIDQPRPRQRTPRRPSDAVAR
ncbi:MAG: hypothetical protein H0X24_20225 [Ktedonobacterales bacterium]|nr:hypothetical protein [Ktedonobacterales bacterium]